MYLLQAERTGLNVDTEVKVDVVGNQQSAAGGEDVPDSPDDTERTGDNQESFDRVEPPPKR